LKEIGLTFKIIACSEPQKIHQDFRALKMSAFFW